MTITKYYSIAKATWNYSLIPCKLNIYPKPRALVLFSVQCEKCLAAVLSILSNLYWWNPFLVLGVVTNIYFWPGKYGSRRNVWDWKTKTLEQMLDLGAGTIPREIRVLHDPDQAQGFVGCSLSSTVVKFFKNEVGERGKGWELESIFLRNNHPMLFT